MDAVDEYRKRLGRYCRMEIVCVADEQTPDHASAALADSIKKKEGERILKHIPEDAYVVTLEIGGRMLSSEELAEEMDRLGIRGISHIVFVIGGSLGLHGDVIKRANYHLSFSRMTFPHQLMRVILMEQIYRSYRIIKGEPYHK